MCSRYPMFDSSSICCYVPKNRPCGPAALRLIRRAKTRLGGFYHIAADPARIMIIMAQSSGGSSASGSFASSNLAIVGAMLRWSISPRLRPCGMPLPIIMNDERISGLELK